MNSQRSAPRHVVLLGNAAPRQCGIATYTEDSRESLLALDNDIRVDLYAMDDGTGLKYGPPVSHVIPEQDIDAYLVAADRINESGADVLWIQHEFGIFGGDAGSHLIALVNRVRIPVLITLHTILENPSSSQDAVLRALIERASAVVVMAEAGREIAQRLYGNLCRRIEVVPHGVPDRAYVEPAVARAKLGLEERPTLLTFGLLSPGKGIEDMLQALPAIRTACPDVRYIVLGATHPNLFRDGRDVYRESLNARVEQLGLNQVVEFVDRFVELDELTEWLAAADIYVTPYHNPAQIVSGTLSYAVGLGKAIVSTPYIYARELLSDGHGVVVPFRDPPALTAAIAPLLRDDETRAVLSERAYKRGRAMTWTETGAQVLGLIDDLSDSRVAMLATKRPTPFTSFEPIERMTDGTGMLQHSVYDVADRHHGYCIDDNARALWLMAVADDLPLETRSRLSSTYAAFVAHAWNDQAAGFRNFMHYDRNWLEEMGSEDSNGRTLWALGVAASGAPTRALRRWARTLFDSALPIVIRNSHSPRSIAFAMLGAAAAPASDDARVVLRHGGDTLTQLVESSMRPDWKWFEIVLSYDNTRLPEALIRAGQVLNDETLVETGLATLEWIDAQTTGHDGQFQPVGTESFGKPFATPAVFDQQPLEAWAMIDACAAAFDVTGHRRWIERAQAAHDWFLGNNVLGLPLIDPESGECGDGLTPFGRNGNAGAESMLAWQASARAMAKLRSREQGKRPVGGKNVTILAA